MKSFRILTLLFSVALCGSCFAEPAAQARKDVPISAARPEYPYAAQQRRLTGSGVFALHVRTGGTVASVKIIKTTGQPVFDQSAITAFRKWRYEPGTSRVVTLPVSFSPSGVIIGRPN